jgi:hypothetical protein
MTRTDITFVPGAADLGSFWNPIIERLPADWTMRACDLPGLGPSRRTPTCRATTTSRATWREPSPRRRCSVDLLDDLHTGLTDGTYPRRLRGWTRPDLLVIDDVGLGQIKKRDDEPTAAHTL